MQLNRRRFLLGATVAVTATASGLRVHARQLASGPQARLEPVSDTYFDRTVVDPYRWMETPSDPDWLPWLRANDAHARTALEALPDHASLVARMRELGADHAMVSLPYQRGDRLLFLRQAPDATLPVVVMREGGRDRVVFDPAALAGPNDALSLVFWSASPDERFISLGLGRDGTEEAVIHILDVESGTLLAERIEGAIAPGPAWVADGSGFFYSHGGAGEFGTLAYRADISSRYHRLGDDPSQDRVILARGVDPRVRVDPHDGITLRTFRNSSWVTAETSTLANKGLWRARLADVLAGEPRWIETYSPDQGFPDYAIKGDELWVWGATGDDTSAVGRRDLSAANPNLETIMATFRGGLFNQSSLVDRGLYVSVDGDGYSQLFFISNEGDGVELSLPVQGAIQDLAYGEGPDEVFVYQTTWLEPLSIWRVSAAGASERIQLTNQSHVDVTDYEVRRELVVARDQTRVPLTVIARRDLARNGAAPCMIRVYGAYGESMAADFDPLALALLERGGVVAIAHVRGGGERGRLWWEAGKGATKPNTWRDLIDCAEHLVADGWTDTDRLGIMGASAGGIAVGRAMTERPDLFALVISQVGLLNAVRFEAETNGVANVPEFGSTATKSGFLGLYAMDTYHHIQDGVRYPTVLLEHGANDSRVAVWHSAKTAARLRAAASPDSGDVYFRVEFDRGHFGGSVAAEIDFRARAYALLLDLARR